MTSTKKKKTPYQRIVRAARTGVGFADRCDRGMHAVTPAGSVSCYHWGQMTRSSMHPALDLVIGDSLVVKVVVCSARAYRVVQ
jgi:hypothetical protein